MSSDTSEQLARSMLSGLGLDHPATDPGLIETHISWIVLAADYAYKIKKPVNLGFLDFSTLERRKFYCEEELRLNRRTAPGIYLDVLPVSGSADKPRVGDGNAPFEYLVRMHRFDNDQLLDRLARQGSLDNKAIFALADTIATFHRTIGNTEPPATLGTPAQVHGLIMDNFTSLESSLPRAEHDRIQALKQWAESTWASRRSHMAARLNGGHVRECHGDMHLANIIYDGAACTLFDCIEFNDALRWSDTAADIAFTIMDIEHFGLPELAHLLLNEYLQRSGDFDAVPLMDYYLAYRALVRAKVSAIRADQPDSDSEAQLEECRHYLSLAEAYTSIRPPGLVLMSGLSGTGKTTIARQIASTLGAIHLRSDVERKRLFGLDMHASSRAQNLDIYTSPANDMTFERLSELARECILAGYPVVLDATFIEADLRCRFERLAAELGIPWHIVECTTDASVARQRLEQRRGDASEATIDQYLAQSSQREAFSAREREHLSSLDTANQSAIASLLQELPALLAKD